MTTRKGSRGPVGRLAILGAAVIALSGCGQIEQFLAQTSQNSSAPPPPAPPSELAELPPAPKPIYAPGDTYVYNDDGLIVQEEVVSVSPDRVVWRNDSGLIWTTGTNVVTPPLAWSSDPELGRGRQSIIGDPSALFPLRAGNVVAFGVRGSSEVVPTGWQDENRCVVAGQETVEVSAGRFTTFRIDCERKDYISRLFYAPVVQNYVLRIRQFPNSQSRKELVSVTLGNDRTKDMQIVTEGNAPVSMADAGQMEKEMETMAEKAAEAEMAETVLDQRLGMIVDRLERAISKLENDATVRAPSGGTIASRAGGGASDKTEMKDDKPAGKYGVHLASYRTRKGAERGWAKLKSQFSSELSDLSLQTTEFDPGDGRGKFVRLIAAGLPSKNAADDTCRALKAKRQFCKSISMP